MPIYQAIFLGIVQGITEFLPVSSSGHLAIFQNIFHIDSGDSAAFSVMLHVGTLFVVFLVYWKDLCKLAAEVLNMLIDIFYNMNLRLAIKAPPSNGQYRRIIRTNYRKFVLLMLVSTFPTALMGYFGEPLIEDAFSTLIVPGIFFIITGVLLFLSDKVTICWKIPKDVSWSEGVLIGIAQGLSIIPGLSRSGSTISACTFCRFERKFAVKYSFILSIPAILGAAVLESGNMADEGIASSMALSCVCGMVSAAFAGYIAIRLLMQCARSRKMRYFAYYCWGVGSLIVIASLAL